jgi:hypothetical protein
MDVPNDINKSFIRRAINEALKEMGSNIEIVDSLRVDSGMEKTPGTPEVASVMFEKISKASIFIADVTLVGKTTQGKKLLANPNVLIEMGYAAGMIGWERIICVMNEHFGERCEQPFDIRNRRFPIDYKLSSNSNGGSRVSERKNLTKWIKTAISGVMEYDNLLIQKASRKLDVNALNVMKNFGHHDYFSDPNPNGWVSGGILDSNRFHRGIERLIDLAIVWVDINKEATAYAYYWTFLGTVLLKKWGIRTK